MGKAEILHVGANPSKTAITQETRKELVEIEEKLGVKISDLTFPKLMTMKGRLEVSEIMFGRVLGTSVLDTVVRGAEFMADEGRVGREIARLVDFDGYPTARLPTIGDITKDSVQHGLHAEGPWYQREPSYVEFDAQKNITWHSAAVGVDITAIRDQRWNLVQTTLEMLGEAFTDHENYDVIMGFDTASTQAYATNHWVTMVNGAGTLRTAGYKPDFLVVGPTGWKACMVLDQFIHASYLGAAGKVMATGQIGELIGIGKVFYCRHVDSLPAEGGKAVWGVMGVKAKSVGLAIKDDLFVDEFDDPLKGLEGGVVRERYVVKIINTSACIQLLAA